MRGEPKEALPYCAQINLSKDSPIYGIAYYCISTIYLRVNFQPEAFKFMELASQSDYITAKRKLGIFLLYGIGIPQKDTKAAFCLIEEAASHGDPVAEMILVQFYMEGVGCSVNFDKAIEILRNRTHIFAKLTFAKLMLDKNAIFSLSQFEEIIQITDSSNRELPKLNRLWDTRTLRNEARFGVARCTLEGIGKMVQNPQNAIAELHDLADKENHHVAQYWLAKVYSDNVTRNGVIIIRRNSEEACRYYLKAAEGGHPDSCFVIAHMLHKGQTFMGLDKEDAWRYFLCAAQKNHLDAQTFVGIYCYTGLQPTKERDFPEAFKWFNKAAKKGDETAIIYLANYLLKECSYNVDTPLVLRNLFNSAAKNNGSAFYMLGLIAMKENNFIDTCEAQLSNKVQYQVLIDYYYAAKSEETEKQNASFRFGLHCLWKAILLNDHKAGNSISDSVSKMTSNDLECTNECFQRVQGDVATR
jgi:TPR repeat protein